MLLYVYFALISSLCPRCSHHHRLVLCSWLHLQWSSHYRLLLRCVVQQVFILEALGAQEIRLGRWCLRLIKQHRVHARGCFWRFKHGEHLGESSPVLNINKHTIREILLWKGVHGGLWREVWTRAGSLRCAHVSWGSSSHSLHRTSHPGASWQTWRRLPSLHLHS